MSVYIYVHSSQNKNITQSQRNTETYAFNFRLKMYVMSVTLSVLRSFVVFQNTDSQNVEFVDTKMSILLITLPNLA
jgi:hypothetical protein